MFNPKTPFQIETAKPTAAELERHLVHSRLSLSARAFLCVARAMPKNWKICRAAIKTKLDIGEHVMRRIMRELREAGYVTTKRLRNEAGQITGRAFVFCWSKVRRFKKMSALTWGVSDDQVVDKPKKKRPFTVTSVFDALNINNGRVSVPVMGSRPISRPKLPSHMVDLGDEVIW